MRSDFHKKRFFCLSVCEMTQRFILGVDESGTGAWAGPFTVGAVLLGVEDTLPSVRDSKKMTPARRRAALEDIAMIAVSAAVVTGTVEAMATRGMAAVWRTCVQESIEECLRRACLSLDEGPGVSVVIDGTNAVTSQLERILRVGHRITKVRCQARADDTVLAASAASVYAKVTRDAEMSRLASLHPDYGWDANAGYGTAQHQDAICRHGLTVHHRDIRPLKAHRRQA